MYALEFLDEPTHYLPNRRWHNRPTQKPESLTMSILVLTSDTLIGTPAAGNIEYNGQFFGTDSNASRAQLQRIVRATAVASTSGTSIAFTGIPAWVERVTVMLSGVSLSGTDGIILQLGDSGGIETTGYVGNQFVTNDAGAINVGAFSSAFVLTSSGGGSAAGNLYSGQVILSLLDASTNTWVMNGSISPTTSSGTARISIFSGGKPLSSTLTQLSIGRSGTNTFDAGTINIMYEG
jgi:hypothetical protein